MSNVAGVRESDFLSSEKTSFQYTSESEKNKFAKQLLGGLGKEITTTRSVKYKKPTKVKLKEFFRRIFKLDKKEFEKKLLEIENEMMNYKG